MYIISNKIEIANIYLIFTTCKSLYQAFFREVFHLILTVTPRGRDCQHPHRSEEETAVLDTYAVCSRTTVSLGVKT